MLVVDQRLQALVGELQAVVQRRVVQRVRRGDRHGARHVGDAIVDDAVDLVGRLGMGGGVRGLEAAALVDGDVDEHRALLHARQHLAGDQLRRGGAGDQHGADDDVGREALLLQRLDGRIAGVDAAVEDVVELAQARDRAVDDGDVGAEADRHLGRMQADDAAADARRPCPAARRARRRAARRGRHWPSAARSRRPGSTGGRRLPTSAPAAAGRRGRRSRSRRRSR